MRHTYNPQKRPRRAARAWSLTTQGPVVLTLVKRRESLHPSSPVLNTIGRAGVGQSLPRPFRSHTELDPERHWAPQRLPMPWPGSVLLPNRTGQMLWVRSRSAPGPPHPLGRVVLSATHFPDLQGGFQHLQGVSGHRTKSPTSSRSVMGIRESRSKCFCISSSTRVV